MECHPDDKICLMKDKIEKLEEALEYMLGVLEHTYYRDTDYFKKLLEYNEQRKNEKRNIQTNVS